MFEHIVVKTKDKMAAPKREIIRENTAKDAIIVVKKQ